MPKQRKNLSGELLLGLETKNHLRVGSTLTKSFREKIAMIEGKGEFYGKAEEALKSKGYQYYGEKDIIGIGSAHSSKPDYIAVKGNIVVIGEIKSPREGPKSAMWRQVQRGDSEEFKAVRLDVSKREETGKLPREVGGHEIIIRGQIPDYVRKLNKTYNPPIELDNKKIILGYSFPPEQSSNVDKAFKHYGKSVFQKIDAGNGVITYLFTL
ncbi:MAG: hypothetical protein ACLQGU_08310 [bacterium]